jgi:hypothetical protein
MPILDGISNPGVAHLLPEPGPVEIHWRRTKGCGRRAVASAANPMTSRAIAIKNGFPTLIVSAVALANAPKTRHQESGGQDADNASSHGSLPARMKLILSAAGLLGRCENARQIFINKLTIRVS